MLLQVGLQEAIPHLNYLLEALCWSFSYKRYLSEKGQNRILGRMIN